MARDRKRAKQRRDRTRRASGAPRVPGARAATDPIEGGRLPADLDSVPFEEEDEFLEAPEPLDHASADIDIANAQLAAGRPELAGEPVDYESDVEAAVDELDRNADAAAGGGGSRRRRTATGVDDEAEPDAGLPAEVRSTGVGRPARGANRVVAFLSASWRELQRVQWPDRRQVAQATGVVLGFVVIAGTFLGLADSLFTELVKVLL